MAVNIRCPRGTSVADTVGGLWSARGLRSSFASPSSVLLNVQYTLVNKYKEDVVKMTYTGKDLRVLVEQAYNVAKSTADKNTTNTTGKPDNYYPNNTVFTLPPGDIEGYSAGAIRKSINKAKVSPDRVYCLRLTGSNDLGANVKRYVGTKLLALINKASSPTVSDSLNPNSRDGKKVSYLYGISSGSYWTKNEGVTVESKKIYLVYPSKHGSITTKSYFKPSFFSMEETTKAYAFGALYLGSKNSPYTMCAVLISSLNNDTTEDTTTTTTTTSTDTGTSIVTDAGDNRPINKPVTTSTSTGTGVTTGICSVYAEASLSSSVIDTIDGGSPINVTWYQDKFAGIHYDARYSLSGSSSDTRKGGWILRTYAQVDNVGDTTNTWENGTAPTGVDPVTGLSTTTTTTDSTTTATWTDPLIHINYTPGMTPSDDEVISSPDQYTRPYEEFKLPGYNRAKLVTHINENEVWKAKTFEFLVGPSQMSLNSTNNVNPIKTGSGFVILRTGPELSRLSLQGYLLDTDQANERSLFFEKYYKEYMVDKVNAFHEYFNDSHSIVEVEGFRYYGVLQALDINRSATSLFLHSYSMQFLVTFSEPVAIVESDTGTYNTEIYFTDSRSNENMEKAPKNIQSVLGG